MNELITYGPGDYSAESPDPWENGQARMPEGWHIDGVDRGVLWAYREGHGSDRVDNDGFVISGRWDTREPLQQRINALVAAVRLRSATSK